MINNVPLVKIEGPIWYTGIPSIIIYLLFFRGFFKPLWINQAMGIWDMENWSLPAGWSSKEMFVQGGEAKQMEAKKMWEV